MMKNMLDQLLNERNLKITKVSNDTGISRNTITSIVQNDNEMYRLDTVNTLCKYLGVTPNDFFLYSPIDIDFNIFINNFSFDIKDSEVDPYETDEYLRINNLEMTIYINMQEGYHSKKNFEVSGNLNERINFPFYSYAHYLKGIILNVNFDNENDLIEYRNEVESKILRPFNSMLYNKLTKSINEKIQLYILESIESKNYSYELKSKIRNCVEESIFVRSIHSNFIFPS